MKKKIVFVAGLLCICMLMPMSVSANANIVGSDIVAVATGDFQEVVDIILEIKAENPGCTDEELVILINNHMEATKGISDIWNSLTDAEKKLVIRYPFDALKVNDAKNVATSQTELKFGYSGLGDRSDAFRHGIWNAKMTILIGEAKAELFASAHEDKDTTGVESDGFLKIEHKNMDLHNNAVGRQLGLLHSNSSDSELADIIYKAINQGDSEFVWLHE